MHTYKVFAVLLLVVVITHPSIQSSSWLSFGGDLNQTHHSKETFISTSNVADLEVVWTKTVGNDVSAIPTVYNGIAYFPDWSGNLWAVEVATGNTVWQIRVANLSGIYNSNHSTSTWTNGSFARASPALDIENGHLYVGDTLVALFYCLNMSNGALIWKTQVDDHPLAIITGAATVFEDKVLVGVSSSEEDASEDPSYHCCSFRGSFLALNSSTGSIIWKTYVCPENYSGNAVWGSNAPVDPVSRSVFFATGNNYLVPDDVQACFDANNFPCAQDPDNIPDAIVSTNVDTGVINWHYSILDSDVWSGACPINLTLNCPQINRGIDADFGQFPILFRTPQGQLLVGATEKNGFFTALNINGTLAWSTAPSGQSDVGGTQWGSAYDGQRIYMGVPNNRNANLSINGDSQYYGGFWAALDPDTGVVLWKTAVPQALNLSLSDTKAYAPRPTAPLTVANGVLFGSIIGREKTLDQMFAMDTETGEVLWSFAPAGAVSGAPTLADGVLLWGSGYAENHPGNYTQQLTANVFYAFGFPNGTNTNSSGGSTTGSGSGSTSSCPTISISPSASPSPGGCVVASPSPSDDDDDGVTINFFFADMLRRS